MDPQVAFEPAPTLAKEINLAERQVRAVLSLLDGGATVPFIARYRKEATGGLDEVLIRSIAERRAYLAELEERRAAILAEVSKQGKLDPALDTALREAKTKAILEDLYLPFKPKRRTRGILAAERGLGPLADRMLAQPANGAPETEAARFVDAARGVDDVAAALAGARDICAEQIAQRADVRQFVRGVTTKQGLLEVKKKKDFANKATKFDTYANYAEPIAKIPSHRYLAIRRGEDEGVLSASIAVDANAIIDQVCHMVGRRKASPWGAELDRACEESYKRILAPGAESDIRADVKIASDHAAVLVFAQNLRELLLAPAFGTQPTLGVDPGQRTGSKCAVVDATGRHVAHDTLYLVQGSDAQARARATLLALVNDHGVRAIAVGNGTHGRETEAFIRETLQAKNLGSIPVATVNEAGASVYSASDIAREEFPDLDLTVRGAISIARRLQDPLAELVKVDPKSIGVGQYQHDVAGSLLERKLSEVVESCVNLVGVELNTASAALLSYVSGIGPTLAKRIVAHRNARGSFVNRKQILEVAGVGNKTFEQAAGFLRIRGANHPLDASAVHPERYGLVESIAKDLGVSVTSLIGNEEQLTHIDKRRYLSEQVGTFTIDDIVAELHKPGRDPRATFEVARFRDDVRTMDDLVVGMKLEGVVTNVTAFGAFIDVGVHQDGLCHISQLADRFVNTPSDVVRVGDKIKVTVLDVDRERRRIGLSARSDASTAMGSNAPQRSDAPRHGGQAQKTPPSKFVSHPFAGLKK